MRSSEQKKIERIITRAKKLVGTPYSRGAHLPSSSDATYFDCSSFVQHLFKTEGIDIPRSSILQAADPKGHTFVPLSTTTFKKGDLIFMRSSRGFHFDDLFGGDQISIGHVGLYIGNGDIIHASKRAGGVAIESLKTLAKDPLYTPLLVKRYFFSLKPFSVPSFSQYEIEDTYWKKRSCGAVSLEMILAYYNKKTTLKNIITKGLSLDAYDTRVGWMHAKLVEMGKHFGLKGANYDWAQDTDEYALYKMGGFLRKGPLIVSIHKSLNPSNGGHLVVVTGIDKKYVYYNEPASHPGTQQKRKASLDRFIKGWKKRAIFLHP